MFFKDYLLMKVFDSKSLPSDNQILLIDIEMFMHFIQKKSLAVLVWVF